MAGTVYGDGTITKRSDGRLQVVVTVDGQRRYAMIPARMVAKDPKAAMKAADKARRALVDQRDGSAAGSTQTLEVWLRSWIDSLSLGKRVGVRTLEFYRSTAEGHIIPKLGSRRLDKLNEGHVQAWLDADTGSPQTVAHHRAVLRRALNVALKRRLVPRNVAVGVELRAVPEFEGKPLTIEEVRKLVAATSKDRLGALWLLALDTGWRESELLGLGRDDVDVTARTATLTAQLRAVRGRGKVQKGEKREAAWQRVPTKRPRQLATVSIAPATAEALDRHLRRMAAERQPTWTHFGHLFVTAGGKPIGQSEVLRAFKRACKAAGIEERRVHDLRVTSATILRELGVPEDIRMLRHGHATTKMARHYAQARTGVDRSAADALGVALAGEVVAEVVAADPANG